MSVVKETCEAVRAENAVEGMPSLAASHAAPLFWPSDPELLHRRIADVHGSGILCHSAEVGCESDRMFRTTDQRREGIVQGTYFRHWGR